MDCRRNCTPLHPLLSQKSAWPLSPWLHNLCTVARCEQKEGEIACWQDQGECVTVVDPEGGLSPFSPSLPMMGEREGGQYAPPLPPLSPHPYGVGGGAGRGLVWLAGISGARETRLTPSKETCRLSKETCRLSKETCRQFVDKYVALCIVM